MSWKELAQTYLDQNSNFKQNLGNSSMIGLLKIILKVFFYILIDRIMERLLPAVFKLSDRILRQDHLLKFDHEEADDRITPVHAIVNNIDNSIVDT